MIHDHSDSTFKWGSTSAAMELDTSVSLTLLMAHIFSYKAVCSVSRLSKLFKPKLKTTVDYVMCMRPMLRLQQSLKILKLNASKLHSLTSWVLSENACHVISTIGSRSNVKTDSPGIFCPDTPSTKTHACGFLPCFHTCTRSAHIT